MFDDINSTWDNEPINTDMYDRKCGFSFIILGQLLTPEWKRQLFDAETHINSEPLSSNEDEEFESVDNVIKKDWMHISEFTCEL